MADKTLKTRIKLKYDTLTNWQGAGANVVLLKGEIAICEVPTGSSLEQTTPPAILFKVGDGVKTFAQLPWASALAADVYAWAKAANKPTYSTSEITGLTSALEGKENAGTAAGLIAALDSEAEVQSGKFITGFELVDGKVTNVQYGEPAEVAVPEYTLVAGTDGSLTLKKDEEAVSENIKVTGWDNLVSRIGAVETELEGKQDTLTAGSVSKSLLASDVQTSLGKADSAVQSVNGKTGSAVTLSKSDVGLGSVQNKALDTTVSAGSTNYITGGAVKTYVDSAIGSITKFDIQTFSTFSALPKTGVKGTIYLVPDEHSDSNDTYDEYLWVTDKYEKIGNTDVNLSGYVPTSRTIAGLALTGNISSASLAGAIRSDLSIPTAVTEATVSGWGFTKNAGTVTSVKLGSTTITTSGDLTSAVNTLITTSIGALDKTDAAVANQYVTAVSETNGVISVTRKQIAWNEISGKPTITTPAAGKLLDAAGTEIFNANQTTNDTIICIDCGSATELVD